VASAVLSRRVRKVVGYPPLCDLSELLRQEFREALPDADAFEDLPGQWRAPDFECRADPAEASDRQR
jgi:hypothetical protein